LADLNYSQEILSGWIRFHGLFLEDCMPARPFWPPLYCPNCTLYSCREIGEVQSCNLFGLVCPKPCWDVATTVPVKGRWWYKRWLSMQK